MILKDYNYCENILIQEGGGREEVFDAVYFLQTFFLIIHSLFPGGKK